MGPRAGDARKTGFGLKIQRQLTRLVLASLLPAALAAGLLIAYSYQNQRTNIEHHTLDTARALTQAAHEALVRSSLHSPNRPKGWRLEVKGVGRWGSGGSEVVLVRHFDDLVDAMPVPVSMHVGRYHPAVRRYLANRDRQMVSSDHVVRAARILQALAEEAPRRGIDALAPEQLSRGLDTFQEREVGRAHLVLRASAGIYAIRVREPSAQGEQPVTPRPWGQRRTRAAWLDARDWEFVSTGNLELIVEGPGAGYSGDRVRDSVTVRLEDKLPRIFRAIEIERLWAEWREQEREREAAERRRRWEAAMTEARARYDEQSRWEAFVQRSREWGAVRGDRDFLAVAREAATKLEGSSRGDLDAYLDFAETRLDELDPVSHPELLLPEVPNPRPDDLKTYLRGWSPHGPDASGR